MTNPIGSAPLLPQGHTTTLDDAMSEPLIPGLHVSEAALHLNDLVGMAFAAHAPSGHELVLDTGPDAGRDSGFRPLELLLVALGGCTGMDVIAILRKKRQVVTDYRVRVAGVQAQEHPHVYTAIVVQHIVSGPALDPAAVARAVELSAGKYCPVNAMLARACPVTHQYRIVSSNAVG